MVETYSHGREPHPTSYPPGQHGMDGGLDSNDIEFIETVIEVPEIQVLERVVPVKRKIAKEKIVEVRKKEIVEKKVYVPVVREVERIVEVPKVEYRQVPRKKIVDIPVYQYREVIKEVEVPQIRNVGIGIPRAVGVEKGVDRNIPVAVNMKTTQVYSIPKLQPDYTEIKVPIYVPRYIEVPVPAQLIGLPNANIQNFQTHANIQELNQNNLQIHGNSNDLQHYNENTLNDPGMGQSAHDEHQQYVMSDHGDLYANNTQVQQPGTEMPQSPDPTHTHHHNTGQKRTIAA